MGLGDPIAISSTHGLGVGDLLDEVTHLFPEDADTSDDEDEIKVAVIGKPNAGKSSLINKILGEDRVIVSNIAGTTRDAIDSHYEKNGDKYLFIDTAGMRKRGKIDENVERYSVVRSLAAVDRSDVCVIMIDANEGITEQDTKVAGYAHEQGKACIFAVNKWDIVSKDTKTMKNFTMRVREEFAFMSYAEIIFISAKTGQRVDKLLELIKKVNEQHKRRITTGMLNELQMKTVEIIRETNPTRVIALAANENNGVWQMWNTEFPANDKNCIISLHVYDDMSFTHQGATWDGSGSKAQVRLTEATKKNVTSTLENCKKYAERTGRKIWISEWGTYLEVADKGDVSDYTNHFTKECKRLGLAHCYWEFYQGFGMYDLKAGKWKDFILDNFNF